MYYFDKTSLALCIYSWLFGSTMLNEPMPTQTINAINTRCYNVKADYWDRLPFADFLPAQIMLKHHPESGMKALDIGSGTGLLAEWLVKQGFAVQCLDPSDEMVRRCRSKKLNTLQTTIQKFSCHETFGLITAVLSLIHVPKREISTQFKRFSNWLNPKGIFVLAVIEGEGEGIGERNSKYPRYFSYYSRQEILNLIPSDFDCTFETRVSGPVSYLVFILQKKNPKLEAEQP
jgi:2-polyprenyl-3-methyl-5-hydroxy-6-metoxy-1,4-benzoquinol methylase